MDNRSEAELGEANQKTQLKPAGFFVALDGIYANDFILNNLIQ